MDHDCLVEPLLERCKWFAENIIRCQTSITSPAPRWPSSHRCDRWSGRYSRPRSRWRPSRRCPSQRPSLGLRPSSFPQQSRGGQGLDGGAIRGAPCGPRRGRLGGSQADAALATTRSRRAGPADRLYRAQPGPDQVSGALVLWASIGSGAVEGACKHVIQSRFKRAGMRRKQPGFLNVLALLLARFNGTLYEF
jgi:hypothetical protein